MAPKVRSGVRKGVVMTMNSIYNSQKTEYKKPFGAVRAGETMSFTLRVPAAYNCTEPRLVIQPDGVPLTKSGDGLLLYPLIDCGSDEDDRDIFGVELALSEPGLYFYWFDLWVDFRKLYRGFQGEAIESRKPGRPYQLTIYSQDFQTPESVHGGVMYQIFPDRFFEGDPGKPITFNERVYRPDKRKEPYFWPLETDEGYLTKDYFGGDLLGIEKRLPFLHSLGVNWIYLNPIFESHSNHRYDTADYLKVDPYLGTNEDFKRLCTKAASFGIRIILDGVFSHTGADSVYFNQEGRYPTLGACQSPESPYRNWYTFHHDGSYDCWWNFPSLPTCNKRDRYFRDFICGKGGVVDTWLSLGAAGLRLDVADELPDDFIEEIRQTIKQHGEDKLLIGEVWEDASNKTAYEVRRKYFLGDELDGVMNYPFRTAIIDFLHSFDAVQFANEVMTICENYPAPALAACTTHLSTHDTVRIITALAGDALDSHDREWQSGRRLSPEQYHYGIMLVQMAFVLQFTLPGVPCIYYGDEIAMQGYKDPFNRAYYDWSSGETKLIKLVMDLAKLRRECDAFKDGTMRFTMARQGVLAFERCSGDACAAVGVNGSTWPTVVNLLGEDVMLPAKSFAWRTSKPLSPD